MARKPETAQRLPKGDLGYKKVRTCEGEKNPYNGKYREQNSTLNTQYGGNDHGTFESLWMEQEN
ncbi:MAG TPA: hypothetical protein H9687_00060, partial [Firmicutes bacterium]|nr:hypothetical protein [Bacillota bacterium]